MPQLNPYLSFPDGTAREAMQRYQEIFGGHLNLSTFGEFGATESADGIMHAQLETARGMVLMGSDTPPGQPGEAFTGAVSLSLSGDDEEELRGYWDGLAEGGEITLALERQMWGDIFGMVVDRFGVTWLVNITAPATDA